MSTKKGKQEMSEDEEEFFDEEEGYCTGEEEEEVEEENELAASESIEFNDNDDLLEMANVYKEETTSQCLDKEAVTKLAQSEIQRISKMFEIPESTATALLRHYHWETEQLIEKYLDNPDKVFATAKIPREEKQKKTYLNVSSTECLVCGDEFKAEKMKTVGCGHTYCVDCWKSYLELKIKEGETLGIPCMAPKCGYKVPMGLVEEIVSSVAWKKYSEFLMKSIVEDNPYMRWCPSARCNFVLHSDIKTEWEVKCDCGFKLCFKCNQEAHNPSDCEQMKAWEKKCKDDSETSNWLVANTKDCPKCKSSIEKNGGCNHMTCRKCTHEFCWICFGDWRGHTNCNAYKEKNTVTESRAALERYLHYFTRYNIHEQSKKFETGLRESAIVKMMELRSEAKDKFVDVQYLDNATEQLIQCRRILKYTYVYAYFLPIGPEKTFFEYLQADLEKDTEELSGFLEDQYKWQDRKAVQNHTRKAAKRLNLLLEGVKNGLTEVPKEKKKSGTLKIH